MGVDVDAVGKSAHNEDIGDHLTEVSEEMLTDVFAVFGGVTRSYHVDDM